MADRFIRTPSGIVLPYVRAPKGIRQLFIGDRSLRGNEMKEKARAQPASHERRGEHLVKYTASAREPQGMLHLCTPVSLDVELHAHGPPL